MLKNLYAGFSIALTILLTGLLLVHGWLPWPHNLLVRGLLAFLLALRLVWFIVRRSDVKTPAKTALGKPIPELPSAEDIADEYSAVIRNYEKATVNLFVEMLTDPTHYLDRITEFVTIEPDTPRLRLSVQQVYRLGHTHGQDQAPLAPPEQTVEDGQEQTTTQPLPNVLLVPIIWNQRGTLLDHFKVTDAGGESAQTLSYNQTRGLMAYALESLIGRAELDPCRFWGHTRDWYEQQRGRLVNGLVRIICSPGPLHKQLRPRQERISAALFTVDTFPFTDDWRSRLKDFCLQYLDRYVIVAEVRASELGHLGLTYSHCVPLESPTNYPFNQWRERFGLSPSTIDIVHNPFFLQVEAYHLEIAAQPEQYVFDHHLEWMDTQSAITQDKLRSNGLTPYVRLYYEEGRPNAHLYVRRQTAPDHSSATAVDARYGPPPTTQRGLLRLMRRIAFWKKPTGDTEVPTPTRGGLSRVKSVVQFREVPPGALGGATAVAIASAAIITFFALTRLGLGKSGKATTFSEPTDIPALLLVLPGFVTVVLGSWIELSRLKRASLTTYLALAGTMVFSLISALYYLYGTGRNTPGEFTLTTIDKNIQISTDVGWLVLMIIAVTHALFLIRQVISESRYYTNCVRRRVLVRLLLTI
jgi:hypothetical protein